MDRRLAAVLAADVAGYSRLIGKDEAGTIAALRGHLAAMAPVMAAHGGSIVNTAGDSVLAEFGSVVNAVSCAAALQQLLAERNAETDASRCLRFRIGVNQGEIVHEAGEVYGDGVNGSAAAPPAVLDAAREAGSKALELDPAGESNVYRVLALVELYRRDFVAAERLYQRCLDLNPNDANRLMDFGLVIAARGRHDEALARMHEAMRLNPFQPTWYNVRLAMPLFGLGRYAEAAQALRTIPTPGYWSLARLAACYGALGLASEAAATKAAILAERPDFTIADFMQRDVLLERAEDRQTLLQALRSAGLPE